MTRLTGLSLGVLAFTALTACGPGAKIDGKQGAAEALYAASMPSKAGADKGTTPLDLTGAISWGCPQGGKASLTGFGLANITGGNVAQSFTISYQDCGAVKSDVGVAVLNGTLEIIQNVVTSSGTASIDQTLKGNLKVQGAFDDFLNADVRQQVSASALAGTAGVSMKLVGTIATSSGSYAFDESLDVTAGHLSAVVKTAQK